MFTAVQQWVQLLDLLLDNCAKLSHENGVVIMIIPILAQVLHHLRSFNVRHFTTVEATVLQIMASKSPTMA
jgi:hypothetical protein